MHPATFSSYYHHSASIPLPPPPSPFVHRVPLLPHPAAWNPADAYPAPHPAPSYFATPWATRPVEPQQLPVRGTELQLTTTNRYAAIPVPDPTQTVAVPFETLVSIVAPAVPTRTGPTIPLDIVAVIDTSSSMCGSKIDEVKKSISFLMSKLSAQDGMSVVTFADKARVVSQTSSMTTTCKVNMKRSVDQIAPNGSTNLSDGLSTGIKQLAVLSAHRRSALEPPVSYNVVRGAPCNPNPMPAVAPVARRPVSFAAPGPVTAPLPPVAETLPTFYVVLESAVMPNPLDGSASIAFRAHVTLPACASGITFGTKAGEMKAMLDPTTHKAMMTLSAAPTMGATTIYVTVHFNESFERTETSSFVLSEPVGKHTLMFTPRRRASPSRPPVALQPVPPAVALPPPGINDHLVTIAHQLPPIQLVLLFTDGEANRGTCDPKNLTRRIKADLASVAPDATLIAFGFGAEHNASLLRTIAMETQGTYYYMPDTDSIPKLFGDCLGGFMSIAAVRLRLTIKSCQPDICNVVGVRTEHPVKQGSANEFIIDLKDIFDEERRDFVVQLNVLHRPGSASFETAPLFNCDLRYLNRSGVYSFVNASAAASFVYAPQPGPGNQQVEDQIARLDLVHATKIATDFASRGDYRSAQAVVERTRASAVFHSRSKAATCLLRDLSEMQDDFSESKWRSEGAQKTNARWVQHAQQRNNAPTSSSLGGGMYQTSVQAMFSSAAAAYH